MLQIKICGVTSTDDARTAVEAGADAIGLNFYPASSRYVPPEKAAQIVAEVTSRIRVVGVFVNSAVQEIKELADRLPLDYVQLHGDEPPEMIAQLAPLAVIRAFRLREGSEDGVFDYLNASYRLQSTPAAVLADAYRAGSYGGTGEMVAMESFQRLRKIARGFPVLLAGGLNPENVRDAILSSGCDGVDVASGVESAPGRKDAELVRRFVQAARTVL